MMRSTPDTTADWKAMAKRQLVVALGGALTIVATGAANKIVSLDLMRVEKEAEVDSTEAFAWESFNAMVHYYENRIEDLEGRDGCH
jgi:hypothetical protein